MSEVGKFGEVYVIRELVSPEISKELADWLMNMEDAGSTVAGIVNISDREVFIYRWEVGSIRDAYMAEEETFPELDEFMDYLEEHRVDYVDFPEGLGY